MARIFYCGGLGGRVGTLRAVVPVVHLSGVLSATNPKFIGRSFPKMRQADSQFTVLEVLPEEEHGRWKAGFYLIAKQPLDFEDDLAKTLPA